MKTIIFFALVAATFAAPQGNSEPIAILRQASDISPDGSFAYSFETENGIVSEAKGALKNIGAEEPALEVQGQVQYPSDDGSSIQLSYIANENGYQPQGSHLPTTPPVPEAIQRALAYLATAPPQPEN